jgi:hypothetical protein
MPPRRAPVMPTDFNPFTALGLQPATATQTDLRPAFFRAIRHLHESVTARHTASANLFPSQVQVQAAYDYLTAGTQFFSEAVNQWTRGHQDIFHPWLPIGNVDAFSTDVEAANAPEFFARALASAPSSASASHPRPAASALPLFLAVVLHLPMPNRPLVDLRGVRPRMDLALALSHGRSIPPLTTMTPLRMTPRSMGRRQMMICRRMMICRMTMMLVKRDRQHLRPLPPLFLAAVLVHISSALSRAMRLLLLAPLPAPLATLHHHPRALRRLLLQAMLVVERTVTLAVLVAMPILPNRSLAFGLWLASGFGARTRW